jgi:hypothetical protein
MSAYGDLVERCYQKMSAAYYGDVQEILSEVIRIGDVQEILAEVLRTLEMEALGTGNGTTGALIFRQDLLSWLRTSPLSPPHWMPLPEPPK